MLKKNFQYVRYRRMKCSECGNTQGYYTYTPVAGKIATYYKGDGTYDADSGMNESMYDGVTYKEEQKTCYCSECSKKLSKKELEVEE